MNIAITGDKKIAFKIKNVLENEKIDNIKIDIITSEDFIRLDVNLLQKYNVIYINASEDEQAIMKKANELYEYDYKGFIVLISNNINLAVKGYDVGAFKYIILDDNIVAQVKKSIVDIIKIRRKKENYILLNDNKVKIKNIVYVESDLHKIKVHLSNKNDVIQLNGKLDEFKKRISMYGFIRIHKSYLVNWIYILSISRYNATLSIYDNIQLPIPKDRYKEIKCIYQMLLEKDCV